VCFIQAVFYDFEKMVVATEQGFSQVYKNKFDTLKTNWSLNNNFTP